MLPWGCSKCEASIQILQPPSGDSSWAPRSGAQAFFVEGARLVIDFAFEHVGGYTARGSRLRAQWARQRRPSKIRCRPRSCAPTVLQASWCVRRSAPVVDPARGLAPSQGCVGAEAPLKDRRQNSEDRIQEPEFGRTKENSEKRSQSDELRFSQSEFCLLCSVFCILSSIL
jgi:hypothetical protein